MFVLNMTLASGILKAKSGTHSSNLNLVNQFVFPFRWDMVIFQLMRQYTVKRLHAAMYK